MLPSEKSALAQRLSETYSQIESQLDEIRTLARQMKIPPSQVRYQDGTFALNPLLLAKAQVLAAQVDLLKE